MLWSRRYVRGSEPPHTVVVAEREVVVTGKKDERHETLGAGWSFVRGAQAILGLVKDGFTSDDETPEAPHRFHPLLDATWDPRVTPHPEVEERIGRALSELAPKSDRTDELLMVAGPLVLLEWPVGFRFGEVFETRVGAASAERALTDVATELAKKKARLPSELTRLCALQANASAFAPLLRLAEQGASFDGWMDLCDLADQVGKKSDAGSLERLARGKVPADVRDALLSIAKDLKGRR